MNANLTLRPADGGLRLQKEYGVWVFRGDTPLSLDEANAIVRDSREDRDQSCSGDRPDQ